MRLVAYIVLCVAIVAVALWVSWWRFTMLHPDAPWWLFVLGGGR